MSNDDPFGPEEPTLITHGVPTPARGLPLPDFEQGYALGYHRGFADMTHALRLSLLRVGIPPHEVEPIVLTVQKWKR